VARTHTRLIDYRKLHARGKSATLVIKLMIACNDLQLANEAFSQWKDEQPPNRANRQLGARRYFLRLQIAHLFEAFKIQASFKYLEQFARGGTRRQWFQTIVGRVRGNLTFHYDESGTLIERAIADRVGRPVPQYSPITRGSTAYLSILRLRMRY
jgi:hypothetical protein